MKHRFPPDCPKTLQGLIYSKPVDGDGNLDQGEPRWQKTAVAS